MARTKSEDLHADILTAAKELLLEQGFAGVSMQAVADRAGTTKATVYAHFDSKERLAAAVVASMSRWAIDEIGRPDPAAPPAAALEAFLHRFLAVVTSANGVRLQRYLIAEGGRDTALLRALKEGVDAHAVSAIASVLTSAPQPERLARAARLLEEASAGPRLSALFGEPPDPATLHAAVAAAVARALARSTTDPAHA